MIEDPRGGELRTGSHEVKTINKAREWCPIVTRSDLPVTIEQHSTNGGRLYVRVTSAAGKVLRAG